METEIPLLVRERERPQTILHALDLEPVAPGAGALLVSAPEFIVRWGTDYVVAPTFSASAVAAAA